MVGSGKSLKVLFVYSALSTFSNNDLQILQKHFKVKSINVSTFLLPGKGKNWRDFFRLIKGLLWADIIYAWWADLNAFFIVLFCRFFRKKNIIVVGGYEVAYIPEIKYGSLLSRARRFEVKLVLKNASKILTVSKFSEKETIQFAIPKKIKMIHNGVDIRGFHPAGPKKPMVLTVANKISQKTIEIKKLDTFLKASAYLPDVNFVLVGQSSGDCLNFLDKTKNPNVEFTGFLDHTRLLDYYQKAKVYCQLSTHESFGMALVEAMCCECIPVVTRKSALPEIVGETGFFVPYDDPEKTAEVIKKALISNLGTKVRKRVIDYFSLDKREKSLIREILDTIRNK